MSVESQEDLRAMQRVGRVVALVLDEMQGSVQEGMSTAALDRVASAALTRYGARSAPQREYGFPGCTCISINDEIVHGVPADRRLRTGDVVKIDVTADLGGYVADAARTVFVGAVTAEAVRLRASAVSALSNALAVARAGRRVSAIGRVIEQRARQDGFAVIRELCGHGVGRRIHEEPSVPNYEQPWSRDVLSDGLVIAIEPMFASRRCSPVQRDDGWTIATGNGALAVHAEHTVMIRRDAPPLVFTVAP